MELSGLKIGQVTLENPLILAPMAGVTDLPFVYCAGKREQDLSAWKWSVPRPFIIIIKIQRIF